MDYGFARYECNLLQRVSSLYFYIHFKLLTFLWPRNYWVKHVPPSWFWSLMKIKLMLFPQSTYCSEEVSNFDPSWRQSLCYYPIQHIVPRRCRILIPHEDKVDVITPFNILFWGGVEFWSLMKTKLMWLPHSTLVIRGGECWSLMKIKLVLLSQSTYCSEGWQMLIPHEDKVDSIFPNQHIVLLCHNHDNMFHFDFGEGWHCTKRKSIVSIQKSDVDS